MFLYIYEGYVIHLVKYKLGAKIKKRIRFCKKNLVRSSSQLNFDATLEGTV